jgi:hypothetical protein
MAVLLLPTPRLGWRVMPGFMPGIHDFLRPMTAKRARSDPFVPAQAGTQGYYFEVANCCAGSPLSRGRTERAGTPAQRLLGHAGHSRPKDAVLSHAYVAGIQSSLLDVNRFDGVAILHRLPADFRFFVFVQSLVVSAQVSTRGPS